MTELSWTRDWPSYWPSSRWDAQTLTALRVMKESSGEGIGEFTDEFRRMAARGAASTVLALAENLPKIVDSSSVTADVE